MFRRMLWVTPVALAYPLYPHLQSYTKNFTDSTKEDGKPGASHNSTENSALDSPDEKVITDKFKQLRDKYSAPKYPIVLCHGLSGFDSLTLFEPPRALWTPDFTEARDDLFAAAQESEGSIMVNYWNGIEKALTAAGARVLTAKVPPFGAIADRAKALDTLLEAKCAQFKDRRPGERLKVNLVGHSMGGLDARYLISKLQTSKSSYEVVSLTTVGTPHHGSECADFVVEVVGQDLKLDAACPQAIRELTTSHLQQFNKEVPNDPRVAYFSYGALMDPQGLKLFLPTYEIIKRRILARGETHYENDGMVSVQLAMWGEYMGTLQNVDHMDLINWTNQVKAALDKVFLNEQPAFNAVALYLDIAETLSLRGF